MTIVPPNTDDPLYSVAPAYQPLHQVIAHLDLDILQELERFRAWQWQQRSEAAAPDQLRNVTPRLGRSATTLQPQDVVEDLDLEEDPPSPITPLAALMLWFLSCCGLGLGIWWLVSPGDPDQRFGSQPLPTPTPINLDEMPIIPLAYSTIQASRPFEGDDPYRDGLFRARDWNRLALGDPLLPQFFRWAEYQARFDPTPLPTPVAVSTIAPTEIAAAPPAVASTPESLLPQSLSPELLDPTSAELAMEPRRYIAPNDTTPIDAFPNRGEGTFLVVMAYQGPETLTRAREESNGAFVREIQGQRYVQLASFKQLEYARFMADDLLKKGLAVTILEF